MAQVLSLEVLEKEHFETLIQFRVKRQIAETLIKVGDLLLGKNYLREAVLLNQKASRMEKQIQAIKSVIC
jgi:hypothetical protein